MTATAAARQSDLGRSNIYREIQTPYSSLCFT